MMNNVDWIEEELIALDQVRDQVILKVEYTNDEIELHLLQSRIDNLTKRILRLQQLKIILEAYKIVGSKIIIERDPINYAKISIKDW